MNKCRFLLHFFLFSASQYLINGGGSSAPSSNASPEKGSLADLMSTDKPKQTLADLIAAERQKEKESPAKRKTLTELFKMEEIGENEFEQFLNETRENEHLLAIVFQREQNLENSSKLANYAKRLGQKTNEKMLKLNALKQNDPVMSHIMEQLTTFVKEINSGNVSLSLKEYLFFIIEICALRQQISMSQIITKEKFEIKILAKLVKLILEKKLQNKQRTKERNEQQNSNKSKEKLKLRLMYTAVDNLSIGTKITLETDRKGKRSRRKKRALPTFLMAVLIILISVIIVFIMEKVCTFAFARGWDPISLGKNVFSLFKQHNVGKAIKKLPEHQIDGETNCEECAICLSNYQQGEKARELLCNHKFHSKCVDVWIKKQNNCPICREKLFKISPLGKVKSRNAEPQEQLQAEISNENPENNC